MTADVTPWASEAWATADDTALLEAARAGSAEAYGELWRRHLPAAYAVATRHRGRASAEDIVAEASARVLALIQEGKGPGENFRSYFLTTVRTVAVDHVRRDLRVVPADSEVLDALTEPVVDEFPGDGIDADLVREAFSGLSERDQRVLWHTTVEGEAPRVLAPALGMSANAVSARAVRARDALRTQYLDAHASRRARSADSDECRWSIDHLGAYVRGRLPKRQTERVRKHLEECPHAAAVAAELTEINAGFPALLVPLVLLAGAATPGFVSAGALAGLGSGAAAGGGSAAGVAPGAAAGGPPAGPPANQGASAGQQAASTAASVAAAAVVLAGLLGAAPGVPIAATPAPQTPAPTTTPPPTSVTPPPALTTRSPTPPPTKVAAPASVPAPIWTPAVPPVRVTPAPTSPFIRPPSTPAPVPPSSAPPAPTPSVTTIPTSPTPSPTSTTTPPPQAPSVMGVVNADGTGWVRIPDVSEGLEVVLANASGTGTLEVVNHSWSCTPGAVPTLTCTVKANGRMRFVQSGLTSAEPLVVRFPSVPGASATVPLG